MKIGTKTQCNSSTHHACAALHYNMSIGLVCREFDVSLQENANGFPRRCKPCRYRWPNGLKVIDAKEVE